MDIRGEMEPKLRGEIQAVVCHDARHALEYSRGPDGRVNCPLFRAGRSFHGFAPLHPSGLFPDMDFLSASDEPYDNAPFRYSLGELNKVFRFRPTISFAIVL